MFNIQKSNTLTIKDILIGSATPVVYTKSSSKPITRPSTSVRSRPQSRFSDSSKNNTTTFITNTMKSLINKPSQRHKKNLTTSNHYFRDIQTGKKWFERLDMPEVPMLFSHPKKSRIIKIYEKSKTANLSGKLKIFEQENSEERGIFNTQGMKIMKRKIQKAKEIQLKVNFDGKERAFEKFDTSLLKIKEIENKQKENNSEEKIIKLKPISDNPVRNHRILRPQILVEKNSNLNDSPSKDTESPSPTYVPRYS
ncbi:unnamed protein product [Blepharisma stoltei]|uniref:Uncharacterized protein n=1 Tax=Blepharisma stoltei TaxID=1481888 RepID=A0AAU9JF41_9CILI|nr:unnamed protein product [Blepharisma stoltei]